MSTRTKIILISGIALLFYSFFCIFAIANGNIYATIPFSIATIVITIYHIINYDKGEKNE